MNLVLSYTIPSVLILSLILVFIFRKPRFFIFLSALLCLTLLVLDAGRSHYWFYFYLVFLLLLGGYNWRIDNPYKYVAYYNAIKILLAGVYVVTAIQYLKNDFLHTQWPQFIKPLEHFATPEQWAYLEKIAYAIPVVGIFISIGLFFDKMRIAALSFAYLFHVFSFCVLWMQKPYPEVAVLIWHVTMMCLLGIIFFGKANEQRGVVATGILYPAFIFIFFVIAAPVYFIMHEKPLKNKIDLMQSNSAEQFVYVTNKSKLPYYLQSFTSAAEKNYFKLSVTNWALHETNTKQILGISHLQKLTLHLNSLYGTEALVSLPKENSGPIAAK